MIICGFSGIGKTFCADNFPRVIDFENKRVVGSHSYSVMESTFKMFDDMGYDVLLDIRMVPILKSIGTIQFSVVIPSIHIKDEYIERYIKMGKPKDFIKDMSDNWEKRINTYLMDFDIQVETLSEGQYLSNRFLCWSSGFQSAFGLSLVNRVELKDKLRQIDSIEWEYNNPRQKVYDIVDGLNEYKISRKESVKV